MQVCRAVSYAVLDAKFRDMDRLFAQRKPPDSHICTMEECLQKYYINLSDSEQLHRPVKMLWLLQGRRVPGILPEEISVFRCIGKDDPDATPDYYPKEYFSDLSWGAMSLNAQNEADWTEQFWEEFSRAMPQQDS